MARPLLHVKSLLPVITFVATLWIGPPGFAQSSQGNPPARDPDTTRAELANFDRFLDSHRETAEQLRRDPSLVKNPQFLQSHPALQTYLQEHAAVREELTENPRAFMHEENRFDRAEDRRAGDRDFRRQELANFDRFLDSHKEVSQELRGDPARVNNRQFLAEHPDLQAYLQQHPTVREDITANPNGFMRAEQNYDNREDGRFQGRRDPDTTRAELASFDRFLDTHREISQELRGDPNRVNNQQFVESHPDLQAYLQQHPGVREEITENPNAFMGAEQRYDQRADAQPDNARTDNDRRDGDWRDTDRRDNDRRDGNERPGGRDGDTTRGELASFDHFLDSHRETAEQLRRDPSLVKNQQFLQSHPALQTYLQDHQNVRQELTENPNAFMRSENQFDRHEDSFGRDFDRGEMGSFKEFLGGHSDVAQQLHKDPSLARNQQFLSSHPDFQAYLKAHPSVSNALSQNPQGFMKSAQQLDVNGTGGASSTTQPAAPPKQKP
jgi:hypothetical protein